MIKITREADYAIVLMTSLAARADDAAQSAAALSKACRLPLPMAGKILKTLSQSGLLRSQRGARGGYTLARQAQTISVADIVEAVDGPIALTDCSVDAADSGCAYQAHCGVSGHWNRISLAVREALQNVTLADMQNDLAAVPVLPVRQLRGRTPVTGAVAHNASTTLKRTCS